MLTLNINKLQSEVEEREKKKINTFEGLLQIISVSLAIDKPIQNFHL